MELDLSEVSVPDTLQDRRDDARGARQAGRRRRSALEVEPEEIIVQADERKLRQVVFNLLSNAVKFTPPGGRVDVSAP